MYQTLRPCRRSGCPQLVRGGGYCEKHAPIKVSPFKSLSEKSPEKKKFYNSHAWNMVSLRHRRENPLCTECRKNNRLTKATLVHHIPEVSEILAAGGNPLDEKYLFSLCHPCHVRELQKRSNVWRKKK